MEEKRLCVIYTYENPLNGRPLYGHVDITVNKSEELTYRMIEDLTDKAIYIKEGFVPSIFTVVSWNEY